MTSRVCESRKNPMQNRDVSLRTYPRLAPPPPQEGLLAQRGYLIICLAIYGGSLGAAALLVNLLSRTRYPDIPEHMALAPTLLMSGGAFVVCALLGGLAAYWFGQRDSAPRNIIKWLLIGFGFGVLSPIITGGTLPLSLVFVELEAGVVSAGEAPVRLINSLFHTPRFAFTHGVFGLFTGMLAGALFGVGALLMYALREFAGGPVARYGPYALAALLSVAFYAIAALADAPTLARLG